jgi:hypothetical protein
LKFQPPKLSACHLQLAAVGLQGAASPMIVLNDCGTRLSWTPACAKSDFMTATSDWKYATPVA